MFLDFHRIAAVTAVSLVTTAQAFAAGIGSPGLPGTIPTLRPQVDIPGICYTRIVNTVPIFGTTSVTTTRRACMTGEKPGSVFVFHTSSSGVHLPQI